MVLLSRSPMFEPYMDTLKNDLIATHEIFGILEISSNISNFIWDHLPMILLITNESGHILKTNKEACRYLEKSPRDIVGKKLHEVFSGGSTKKYFADLFSDEQSPGTERAPFQSYVDAKTEYTFWQVKFMSNKSQENQTKIYAVIGNNSQELRQAYQGELIKASTLTSMATLAGGVAHEINNPLTVVRGCNELITRMSAENPKMQKLTEDIEKHTQRMADIVHHLRSFSTRTPTTGLSSIDINDAVRSAVDFFKGLLSDEDTVLSLSLNEGLQVKGNIKELESVLHILIENAKDALDSVSDKRERSISIKTMQDNRQVFLIFEDNSCGIPENLVDRIFDPFFTTKGVGKGTGLGLSRLYNIVKMHSGIVDVESKEGHFTRFTISFPEYLEDE
ncbi:MAG: GHKL domain-containing protein [Oligoflexales bacterium]|nr:GHKL domain-containing protein [Oligoflexales bacterium]